MKLRIKNISMFFSYTISISIFAALILACGCTGIKANAPVPEKSIDSSLSIGQKPSDQQIVEANLERNSLELENPEVESVKILDADNALIETKVPVDQVTPDKGVGIRVVESISVSAFDKGILISALSDAPIDQYKTFTIESSEKGPARFVVDLFEARISEGGERKIPVNQGGVERIRYNGYSGKVRIVIDTQDEFLSSFTAQPVSNGLNITMRSVAPKKAETSKNNGQRNNHPQIRFDTSAATLVPLDDTSPSSERGMMPENRDQPQSFTGFASEKKATLETERQISSERIMLDKPGVPERISAGNRYTGEKVALDFFDTDIRNVFRILREVSGRNFAIDKDVIGTVTLTLEQPVPWDQVLDLILTMNQLGKVEENNIIRIARMETITKEKQERQDQIAAIARLREEEKAVEPLITEYFPINYSNASVDILPKLQLILTKERGLISVDTRTNMVIMTDTAEKINHAREIIQRLDMVTPQVIIEARIVEVTSSFSKEIGVQWGVDNASSSSTLGGIWGFDTAVNLPVSNPAGTLGFDFRRITGSPLLIDARLSAAESQGEGKIISAPRVLTLNNKKAIIRQGREIPYTIVDRDGVATTEFKDVDLRLEVTPHVTPDDRITLSVYITKDEVAEIVNDIPSLSTKRAETELLVDDGETIVIGGILLSNEQKKTDSVPGLAKLPVLKWLFKRDIDQTRKEELVIFLTPRIMRLEQKNLLSYQN